MDVYRTTNHELGVPAKAETATGDDIHGLLESGRLFVAEAEAWVIGAVGIEGTAPERLEISRLGVHDDGKGKRCRRSWTTWSSQPARTGLVDDAR